MSRALQINCMAFLEDQLAKGRKELDRCMASDGYFHFQEFSNMFKGAY